VFTLKEWELKADKVSMELAKDHYMHIAPLLSKHRGNVKIDNFTLLNALIYRCDNGCKWRSLPKSFGNRHVIYLRLNRSVQKGMPNGCLRLCYQRYTVLIQP
jgi:transposase